MESNKLSAEDIKVVSQIIATIARVDASLSDVIDAVRNPLGGDGSSSFAPDETGFAARKDQIRNRSVTLKKLND